ncbi:hemolytic protein HlpA [Bacteroidia bacterium]|nr:hemolytic protein HlpA [Bacteroidia bacterium]
MFETPVLFLVFNREDTTQQVFEAIRRQKPKYLFVAADGARKNKPGEAEACQRVRDVVTQIDWDCELKTLFRDENLGCKIAVSEAITWFFLQVEQGIILEDDCLPDPSFFPYCEELLNRYKNDTRIGHISGNCFLPEAMDKNYSYNFSSIAHIWGWATWRRVWQNFDIRFPFWDETKKNEIKKKNLFNSKREEIYFSTFISDTLSSRQNLSVWDVQYFFMLRTQNQLSIYPTVNLVRNIGVGSDLATHTSKKKNKLLVPLSSVSFPLEHPEYVLRNKELDGFTIKKIFFSWKRLVRYFL